MNDTDNISNKTGYDDDTDSKNSKFSFRPKELLLGMSLYH